MCCLPERPREGPGSRGRPEPLARADLGGHRSHARKSRSAARPHRCLGRRARGPAGRGAGSGRPPRGRTASEGLSAPRAALRFLRAYRQATFPFGRPRRLPPLPQLRAGRALRRLRRAASCHVPWPRRLAPLLALFGASSAPLWDLWARRAHCQAGQGRRARRLQPLLQAAGGYLHTLRPAKALLLRRCREPCLRRLQPPAERALCPLRGRTTTMCPLAGRASVRALLQGCTWQAWDLCRLRGGAPLGIASRARRQVVL